MGNAVSMGIQSGIGSATAIKTQQMSNQGALNLSAQDYQQNSKLLAQQTQLDTEYNQAVLNQQAAKAGATAESAVATANTGSETDSGTSPSTSKT